MKPTTQKSLIWAIFCPVILFLFITGIVERLIRQEDITLRRMLFATVISVVYGIIIFFVLKKKYKKQSHGKQGRFQE